MPDAAKSQHPKLLDDVRKVMRLRHYSTHTERSYVAWIIRFTRFHRMWSRADLFPAEPKIEVFLTDRAVHGNVAASGHRGRVGPGRDGNHDPFLWTSTPVDHILTAPGLSDAERIVMLEGTAAKLLGIKDCTTLALLDAAVATCCNTTTPLSAEELPR